MLSFLRMATGKELLSCVYDHYIYIYAFSRHFYPKRLTLHSSYSFTFYQLFYHYNIVVFNLHNNDCEICILDMAIRVLIFGYGHWAIFDWPTG